MRLQYEISATGVGQLKRVFRSVEQEAQSANRRAVDRSTRRWARSLAQIKHELARTEAAGGRVGGRSVVKSAGGATGAAETRAHTTRMANITREEQARLRAISRAGSVEQRGESARHRIRLRNIEREKAREIAAIKKKRIGEETSRATLARSLGSGAARSLSGAVGTTAGLFGGALALGGGFAAVGAIRNQMDVERESSVLAAKAIGTPGEKRNREEIRTSVIRQSRELGATSGLGAQGVIGALSQFTAISGRLGMGQQLASFMADVSDASGAAIEDVGRTSGQIVQAMMARGMEEPDALAQTKGIIASMMAQAKVGSIEFADLATQMGKVMSSTAAFDGKVEDLATTMGAISQLAIAGAASSPEEAMTAILRFRDDLIQNEKRFSKQGIDVFADKEKTRLRAPEQILIDMLTKTKGSLPNVSKLFGIRAAKAVTPFQALYTEKGGGKAGTEAVMQLLETAKATMPKGEIEASASFRRSDADKQMAMNVERLNAAIGQRLLPVVTDLIPRISELIPSVAGATEKFARFASWAIKNPYEGMGAIIAGLVAKDIASAGLNKVLSSGLSRMFTKMPATSIALSAATVTATIGALAIDTMAEGKAEAERVAAVQGVQRESLIGTARQEIAQTGTLSERTRNRLITASEGITKGAAQNAQVAQQGLFETMGNMVTGGPGFEAVAKARRSQDFDKEALEQAKQINALLLKAARATVEASDAYLQAVRTGNPGGEQPISARRQSPILNRGG